MICKECQKLNSKRRNYLISNNRQKIEHIFSSQKNKKRKKYKGNKYLENLKFLVIKEMQIKAYLRFHIPVIMAIIKEKKMLQKV